MGMTNSAIRERREKIWNLRREGYSIAEIAQQIGVSTKTVSKYLVKERTRVRDLMWGDIADDLLMDLERIEYMLRCLAPSIKEGSARAIEVAAKLLERRAKMKGYDAPEKKAVTVDIRLATMSVEELRAEAERLGLISPSVPIQIPCTLPGEFVPAPIPQITGQIIEAEIVSTPNLEPDIPNSTCDLPELITSPLPLNIIREGKLRRRDPDLETFN